MTVQVRILHANMARFLGPTGPIARKVTLHTRRAFNAVQAAAPVDTGKGRAAMNSDVIIRGRAVVGRIFMPPHLWYQDRGTGVYAGKGLIRPKRGKYLVWEANRPVPGRKGRNRNLVFATKVKGVPPKDFVVPAVRSAVPWPVRTKR